MRTVVLLSLLVACSGEEAAMPDAPDPCGGTHTNYGLILDCVPNGLAGVVFDGSPWHLVGERIESRFGAQMSTPIDRMISLQRTGTGCGKFAIATGATIYDVSDTSVTYRNVAEYKLQMCRRASDGALFYAKHEAENESQGTYTDERGTLTQP